MGVVSAIVDGVVVLFSAVLAVAVPLIDMQICLPGELFPAPAAQLKQWYVEEFGDYLIGEKPHFFVGLVWIEMVLLWPLLLSNIYGIVRGRSWAATTSLIAGVVVATSMSAVMGELLGSGRATKQLLQMYGPFVGFSVLAILRGLLPRPRRNSSASGSHSSASRKKRA